MSEVTVTTKSSWLSKINWAQIVAMAAMLLTVFGIEVPEETKAQILAAIVAIQGVVTWVLRTWFTKHLTDASVG